MTLLEPAPPVARVAARARPALTVEQMLYLAVFALALALRLYGLGAHPLNDPEAREALTVLRFLRGAPALSLPHSPAYFFFTYFGFLLFDSGTAIARLAPAVAGALITLLPWLFRSDLGRGPAVLTAGLLAISSSLLAASRSADGTMIAVLALGLGVGLLRRYLAGGAAAWGLAGAAVLGVGLAGGAAFLTGLLILALLLLVAVRTPLREALHLGEAAARVNAERWALLAALGLAALVVATLGLLNRAGFSALAESWLRWLLGFAVTASTGRSPLLIPVFLAAYDPLLLVFGLLGAARAFRQEDRAGQVLAGWLVIAALFTLFYSGRTLFDGTWLAVPLAALSARQLAGWAGVYGRRSGWPLAAILAGVLLALAGFVALNLLHFLDSARFNASFQTLDLISWVKEAPNLALAGLALMMMGLVVYLFAAGWSRTAAAAGLLVTVTLLLGAVTVGAGYGLTQLRAAQPVELWWTPAAADDLNRLEQTLTSVSNFNLGQEHEIAVTVEADPQGALAWTLRNFPKVVFVNKLDATMTSPVVIAPDTENNPALGSAYVGQAFTQSRRWSPASLGGLGMIDWLLTRQAPEAAGRVILWVRQDVQQPATIQKP